MNITKTLAEELNIRPEQAEAAVKLIDEGNTIPFIARYRKEATGSLNDEVLRLLDERLRYLRNLDEKKQQVLATIREQGALTAELEKQIMEAATLVAVDDLYRPYRPKRRTRATVAKERGLAPLAAAIREQKITEPLEVIAASYVDPEKEVASVQEAIDGAGDILAESRSQMQQYFVPISARPCRSWGRFIHRQRTPRLLLLMRNITTTRSRCAEWPDTVCWR